MRSKYVIPSLAVIALVLGTLFLAQSAGAASILITNSSDTLSTFRTNVNTSQTLDHFGTTTTPTIGHLPYFTGLNTFGSVATGSSRRAPAFRLPPESVIGSGLTITNSGVTSLVAGTNITLSGSTGAVTVSGIGYPFPSNATSTSIAFNAGLSASTLTVGSLSGLLKASAGVVSAAVSNTDYQAVISLTTSGSSGAATLNGSTLNIPQYVDTTRPIRQPIR
jgi:hypothetical protein